MFSSLSSNSLWQRNKKDVAVTVSGSTTKMPTAKAGASIRKVKRPVIVFVVIIYINKRMKEIHRDYYYYHPQVSMRDKSFMMIPTPKDFGQYLQNKRNRRRKK